MPEDEIKVAITADTAKFRREMVKVAQVSDKVSDGLERIGKAAGKLGRGFGGSAIFQLFSKALEKDPLLTGVVKGGFDPNAVVNAHLFLISEAQRGLRRLENLEPGAREVQENISRRELEAAREAAAALIRATDALSRTVEAAPPPGPSGEAAYIVEARESLEKLLPALRRLLEETPDPAVRGLILDADIPELREDVLGVRIERLSEEINQVAGEIADVERRLADLRSRPESRIRGRPSGVSASVLEEQLRQLETRRSELEAARRQLEEDLSRINRDRGAFLDPGGGGSLGNVPSDGGVIPAVFGSGTVGAVNGVEAGFNAVDGQAAAWQAVLDRVLAVPPALARTRQETLDVDRAVRDLGFTFASAFEDAIVAGESLSDILQGLEEDILRILTRLLITEPLARGLTAGLGSFTGGGLEGLIGGGFGALANLFPSPVAGLGLGSFNALAPIAAQDVANPLLAGIFQSGGPVHGTVRGPGGPTGDRIPALLSDGEFVVNAEAARRHRRLLEMINAGITPPAFATGGRVAPFLRFVGADVSPPRQAAAPEPRREPSFAGRPVVVHIHNPTSVPEIQRGMAQIRGSLREMLARAERRGE